MTPTKRQPLHRVIYLTCFLLSTSILGISLWGHYQIARDLLIKQTMTLTEQHVARSTEALETMIATMDVANEAIIRRITLESLTTPGCAPPPCASCGTGARARPRGCRCGHRCS